VVRGLTGALLCESSKELNPVEKIKLGMIINNERTKIN
jgi:hypothetical protein